MISLPTYRPAVLGLTLAACPALALAAAQAPSAMRWGWLPLALVFAVIAHILLGRGLKALVGAVLPLASGSPETAGYERTVYGTAGRATGEIVLMVLIAGAVFGVGQALATPWLTTLGALIWLSALALDLHRWERVTTSADYVWFQRGWGQKVHQVAIENIRDVAVVEKTVDSFTVRNFKRNHVCRINLRMADKRVVALPKTDAAHGGVAAMERTANHIRSRKQLLRALGHAHPGGDAPERSPEEREMLRALKHLRQQAAASTAAVVVDGADEPANGGRAMPTLRSEILWGEKA
jgi:hypothetical protein